MYHIIQKGIFFNKHVITLLSWVALGRDFNPFILNVLIEKN
jgi:hypothetical protein